VPSTLRVTRLLPFLNAMPTKTAYSTGMRHDHQPNTGSSPAPSPLGASDGGLLDATLSPVQFCKVVGKMRKRKDEGCSDDVVAESESELRELFASIDTDGDGTIGMAPHGSHTGHCTHDALPQHHLVFPRDGAALCVCLVQAWKSISYGRWTRPMHTAVVSKPSFEGTISTARVRSPT
jgi:hypothetical protein